MVRVMFTIGKWRGVAVRMHWTTVAMLLLIGELVADWLPTADPGHSTGAYWATGLAVAVLFAAAVLVHELAHTIVARHYKMQPKAITLWMLGGMTDLATEPPSARAEAAIALAGPAATGGVAVLAGAAAWLMPAGLFAAALGWLAAMSLFLAVFNLIPAAPFDGGAVLRGVLWWRRGDRASAVEASVNAGRVIGLALIILGAAQLLVGFVPGLWLVLIGWFVRSAANAQAAPRLAVLEEVPVERAMAPTPVVAPKWWTVGRVCAELAHAGAGQRQIPVVDLDGAPLGVVSAAELLRVPASRRDEQRIADLIARRRGPVVVPSGTPLTEVAPQLSGATCAVVVDEGRRPTGIVTAADIALLANLIEHGLAHRDSGAAV